MEHRWNIVGQILIREDIVENLFQCSQCKDVRLLMKGNPGPEETGCKPLEIK